MDSKSEKQQPLLIVFLVYICFEASITVWRWLFWEPDTHYNFISYGIFEVLPFIFLATITADAVVKLKPNAIFWGKTTLIYFIVISCLHLLVSNFDNLEFNMVRGVFTLCVSFAWILYFLFSKQVNQIFPKERRKVSKRDKVLLATLLILPYVLVFFAGVVDGFIKAQNKNNQEHSFIVADNEYTDGVIAFSIPDDCSCVKTEEGNSTIFWVTKNKWKVLVYSGAISNFDDAHLSTIAEDIYEKMLREQQLWGAEATTLSVFDQRDDAYIFHKKFRYSDLRGLDQTWELDAYVLFGKSTHNYAIVRETYPINSSSSEIDKIVGAIRFK